MCEQENKLLVRRYIEEIVNTGDVTRLADFIAPEYAEVYRNVRYAVGPEGAKKHILGVRETYPDLRVTIDQQIAEGDWVASQITARGTHRGTWLGIRPTGRAVVSWNMGAPPICWSRCWRSERFGSWVWQTDRGRESDGHLSIC